MARDADDRPSGPDLPRAEADGRASAVEEAARWLDDVTGGGASTSAVASRAAQTPPPTRQSRRAQRSDGAERATRTPSLASPPDDVEELGPEADPEAVARKILLDQLTGRARSRAELAEKLAKRRVPEEVAERLLDRFEEVGLVDDVAFARLWVESRQSGKGLGRRALAQELRRKGIEEEVAREALDDLAPDAEEAAARALVRRRLRSMSGLDRATATRRLAGMLARKGHQGEVVWRIVREELDAAGAAGDDDGSWTQGDHGSP